MDPISASALALNIHEEKKRDAQFEELIGSCKSLSRYDAKTFRTLLPQIAATFMAVSLHISVGLSMAFSGILIPALDKTRQNGTDFDGELYATKPESAWVASIAVIAVPFGSITCGIFADRFGRLWALKLSILPSILGWCLIASAQSIPQILVGRFLTGFGTPWSSIPAIVYISEIARVDIRGSLVVTAPTLASAGMLLSYLKGWFLHWRTAAWLCNIYCILPVFLLFFIPESPPWLVSKGKFPEAAKSLHWLNRNQPQPDNRSETLAELHLQLLQKEHQKKLQAQARRNSLGSISILKEFLKPTGYKPMLLLTGMYFFQMFSGIYITLFYSVTFLEEMGSNINPYFASTLLCFMRMVLAFGNSYLLKRFNRRSLLMVSGISMAICMTCSGFSTHWIKSGASNHAYLPVAFMLLYVTTSMIGMLTIPWMMMSELFPIEIRGVANSAAYSVANLMMFASIQSFYGLISICRGYAGIQWFFAVVSVLASLYTYIFMPETHKKKLTEITDYFVENSIYMLSKKKKPKRNKTITKPSKKDIIIASENSQEKRLMDNV
uniref:Facilitated trehalose transporter Tret1-2 homolog isoform X1 n=1 Tax=Diabrotica virgifera virgifera TaxID=50390 RepID=A0A6P7F983_DIAVI